MIINPNLIALKGGSMQPALHHQDLLELAPITVGSVLPGDVIAFQAPHKIVVHRVIAVENGYLVTRGDNRRVNDPWQTPQEKILGRVDYYWRNDKRSRVPGGRRGRLNAILGRIRLAPIHFVERNLRSLYLPLLRTGPRIAAKLPKRFHPKVVIFKSDESTFAYLMLMGRNIGSLSPEVGRWTISRPYRLLVEGDDLPLFSKRGNPSRPTHSQNNGPVVNNVV